MHMLSFPLFAPADISFVIKVRVGGCGSAKFTTDVIVTQIYPKSKLKALCFDKEPNLETPV